MRKVSDKGTDIAITLDQGSTLKHNDVILMDDSKMILAKIEPEDVAMIEVKDSGILNGDDEAIAIALRIGHTIGNLHRPIKIEGKKVNFPIQTEGEIDTFRKLLHHVVDDHIEIKRITMVFEPDEGAEVHEH
jgi:urease accessory protein